MGSTYTNLIIKGADVPRVKAALLGRDTYVGVTADCSDACVVFDGECDEQFNPAVSALAQRLSAALHCSVIGFAVFDSGVLWYHAFADGVAVDEYWSMANEDSDKFSPVGGDAEKLRAVFGDGNIDIKKVDMVLHDPVEDEKYLFASERYEALCSALGLPSFGASCGFMDVEVEDCNWSESAVTLTQVGDE